MSFDFASWEEAEIAMAVFVGSVDERDKRTTTASGGRRRIVLVFALSFSETKDLKSVSFSKVSNEESVGRSETTIHFELKASSRCLNLIGEALVQVKSSATSFSFFLALFFFRDFPILVT